MIFEANVAMICETARQHMLPDFDKTRSSFIATYVKREFLYMSRDISKNDKILIFLLWLDQLKSILCVFG